MTDNKPLDRLHQQRIEELCGSSMRALTGLSELRHQGRSLFLANKAVANAAPHIQLDPIIDDFIAQRAVSDAHAMRLNFSDQSLHRSLHPSQNHGSPIKGLVFDLLEQLRVESLVDDIYPGIKSNLHKRFCQWSLRFYHSGHAETYLGLLIYTVAQIVWSRVSGIPTLEETDDLIEVTRSRITAQIGAALMGLKKQRENQKNYAVHALFIANFLDDSIAGYLEQNVDSDSIDLDKELSRIALAIDFSDDSDDSNSASCIIGNSQLIDGDFNQYKIFTREFDVQIVASSLVRKSELKILRDQLDLSIRHQGINITRLSRQISQLLALPARDGWVFGEEEGVIDGRRLTQIVTSVNERRLFLKDRYRPKQNCQVSFLIDCSGSMKKSIGHIATLVDSFSRALDLADIDNEILGFSTADWNGGKTKKRWLGAGKPANPGRLNERCHLIFKSAKQTWRKARREISAILKTSYFREGLDGEAVEWACSRLHQSNQSRKILIVISDGSPMDSATNLANDDFYLDSHLGHIVNKYDKKNALEIYALGLGLSLSNYYRHSLEVDLTQSLSNSVFLQILQMIAKAQNTKS